MLLTRLHGVHGGMAQLHHHGKAWMFGVIKLMKMELTW